MSKLGEGGIQDLLVFTIEPLNLFKWIISTFGLMFFLLFRSYGHFYLFIRSSGFLFIQSSGFGLLTQLIKSLLVIYIRWPLFRSCQYIGFTKFTIILKGTKLQQEKIKTRQTYLTLDFL